VQQFFLRLRNVKDQTDQSMMLRALIAEDDEQTRLLLREFLEEQGLRVTEAKNGREALEELDRSNFNVIVLDLMMPEISGYEVLHHLHEQKPDTLTCLIIVTGVAEPDLIQKVGTDPAFRVLRKPVDLDELKQAVKGCLAQVQRHSIGVRCLTCDREEPTDESSEDAAYRVARSRGWHVVTFVREDVESHRRKPLFISFCPTCSTPATR
jgi:two-component system response regulator (stage 0 sporulation protein F)